MVVVKDDCLLEAFLFLTRDELDDPMQMVSRQFTHLLTNTEALESAPLRVLERYERGVELDAIGEQWLSAAEPVVARYPRFFSRLGATHFRHPTSHGRYHTLPFRIASFAQLVDTVAPYPWLRVRMAGVTLCVGGGERGYASTMRTIRQMEAVRHLWAGSQLNITIVGCNAKAIPLESLLVDAAYICIGDSSPFKPANEAMRLPTPRVSIGNLREMKTWPAYLRECKSFSLQGVNVEDYTPDHMVSFLFGERARGEKRSLCVDYDNKYDAYRDLGEEVRDVSAG